MADITRTPLRGGPAAGASGPAADIRSSGSDRRRWLILVVLCIGQLMIVLDATVVNVALPVLQHDLHFTVSSVAWVIDAYLITFGGLLLLAGRLGDLLGRKGIFLAGMALFTVSSFLCGVADSQQLLIAARFLQGAGAAAMAAMVLTILVSLFTDPKERLTAMGVYAFVASAGGSIGLLVGGVITQIVSWHWIFFINIPIGIATLVLSAILIPRKRGLGLDHGVDLLGALLVTAAPSLAVYTIVAASQTSWDARGTMFFAALTLLTVLAFVVVERRVRYPLVPLRIFNARIRTGAQLARTLFPVGMFGTFFLSSLYLHEILGYSPIETGLAFLPCNLLMAVFSLVITRRLVARFGARVLLLTGLVLVVGSLLLLSRAPQHATYATDILPALVALGVGAGLFFMPSIALSMAGTRPEESGLASGLANVSLQFGAALGVALLAGISSSTAVHQVLSGVAPQAALLDGFHEGFLVAAAVVALAVVSVGLLLRPGQVSAERVPAVPVFSRPRLALPSAPAIRISQAHLEQAPAADGSILRDLDREEVRVA
jgi:EmrB/QacA subfamily drug resistance transporter